MKFGFRTPSLKRRIAARTSIKRYVRHSMGLKMPRGWGFLTNPKKAFYNRIYYRTTFGIDDIIRVAHKRNYVHLTRDSTHYAEKTYSEEEESVQIKSADISNYQTSSSDQLLKEIQEKHSLREYHKIYLLIVIPLAFVLLATLPFWIIIPLLIVGIPAYNYFKNRDAERKTVLLTYQIDVDAKTSFERINKAFAALSSCEAIWSVVEQKYTSDWKHNSGATNLIQRNVISIKNQLPKYFVSNITPPSFVIFNQTFYFFPDRILIFERDKVASIRYSDLELKTGNTPFIESGNVPKDAQIIGYTWQYVNKDGGPDRRFNYNPQRSRVLYSEIHMNTSSGLNIIIQCSNKEAGTKFVEQLSVTVKS